MALTIKTIVKLFILFLFFQISINFIVELVPEIRENLTDETEEYLEFMTAETNLIDSTGQGSSLLTDFVDSIETENLFNDSIIDTFLGIFQVVGTIILFIVEVGLLILITPSIVLNLLFYNFIANSSILGSVTLIVNLFFYMTLFYIVFKARTQN